MTTPIPDCPQPETPIHERAWADGQDRGTGGVEKPSDSDAVLGRIFTNGE